MLNTAGSNTIMFVSFRVWKKLSEKVNRDLLLQFL
jgi:hypothetical protein